MYVINYYSDFKSPNTSVPEFWKYGPHMSADIIFGFQIGFQYTTLE